MIVVHYILLLLRSRFLLNKAVYDTKKMSLKGPCILAWFWVRFPEHFMFIYTTLLAQLHANYGETYDVTYHGRHTNDSSFI